MERHPLGAAPGHLAAAARLPAAQPGAQVWRIALSLACLRVQTGLMQWWSTNIPLCGARRCSLH